ncbi:MAG: hypothetical protein JKY71_05190 [Alphaproteobacteria bacterium]|nr:hypothetical protein [Alphaproteobacteria bacterium]
MSAEQPSPENKRLVNTIIKADGVLFTLGGIFLLSKDYFMEFELLGDDGDMFLGLGLMVTGITSIIIADKFFPPR